MKKFAIVLASALLATSPLAFAADDAAMTPANTTATAPAADASMPAASADTKATTKKSKKSKSSKSKKSCSQE